MSMTALRHIRRATLLIPLLLCACQPAVLDPQGPIGQAQLQILLDSLLIMLAIVLPTIAATLGFAWWFRAGNVRARYLPDWEYSGRLELIIWFIPLLTIMLLGGVTWIGAHDLDPGKPLAGKTPALEVQVVSLDWKWLFIYPEQHVASVNQLAIPVGRPVHFVITSSSVLNAFFIPQLGSMIYAMNGMQTHLNLQADAPGAFQGMSAHFSGDGFSDMHFVVTAMPPAQFDAWAAATRAGTGPALDQAAYAALAKQDTRPPMLFHDADPALFAAIVQQTLPPGPGPDTESPSQHVSPKTEH